ncbi:hypothetical protein ACLOJK_026977 [Asimina triloba]
MYAVIANNKGHPVRGTESPNKERIINFQPTHIDEKFSYNNSWAPRPRQAYKSLILPIHKPRWYAIQLNKQNEHYDGKECNAEREKTLSQTTRRQDNEKSQSNTHQFRKTYLRDEEELLLLIPDFGREIHEGDAGKKTIIILAQQQQLRSAEENSPPPPTPLFSHCRNAK